MRNEENTEKKSGSVVKKILIGLVMAALVVGFYFAISSRNSGGNDVEEKAQLKSGEELLRKNLEQDYPLTPTAVVSYYSDLLLVYYNDDCSDSMRKDLMNKSRLLYDDELLEDNSEDDQLRALQADVADYEKNKRQIINFTVCDTGDVKYGKLDGEEVALAAVSYRVREKKDLGDVEEEFFLRKDEEGRWKILGWQLRKSWKKESSDGK